MTSTPLALGFGLSRPEHLRSLRGKVDAAIVGSALLDAIGKDGADPAGAGAGFVRWLREGL
jgi:tryptophan synthase alpha chain